jgi:hypothetical protein
LRLAGRPFILSQNGMVSICHVSKYKIDRFEARNPQQCYVLQF